MNSFDFFDTLATRRVARPADVFRLVELRIGWTGFAEQRVRAERAARRNNSNGEVTLAAVYAALPEGEPAQRERAMHEEMRLEAALLVPIRSHLALVSAGDLVISDTYLPAQHLACALEGFGVSPLPRVVVSCEAGAAKADGRLWDRLIESGERPASHLGDNPVADVREPQRRGIATRHYRGAALARWERRWAQVDGSLCASVVAGCARAARLAAEDAGTGAGSEHAALREIVAAAVAPAWLAFVDDLLARCRERGVRRIVFLARDGQLLHRLAQRRAEARGEEGFDLRYALASRHALHLPGFDGIAAAQSWLLEDTPQLTLAHLAARAGTPVDDVLAIAPRHGVHAAANEVLDAAARALLPALVQARDFVESLADTSARCWPAAFDHLAALGFAGDEPIALVDVGWSGRLQASVRRIVRKAGRGDGAPVHGFYFCLSCKLRASDRDRLDGFAFDPERDHGANTFDAHRSMVEALLDADHGSTLGYAGRGPDAHAVLGDAPDAAAVAVVHAQQSAALAFADEWARAEEAIGREYLKLDARSALKVFAELLGKPSRQDAAAFAGRSREAGIGEAGEPLVRRLPLSPAALSRSRWGLWPEGSLAYSGGAALLPLARHLRDLRALRRHPR